MSSGGLEDPHQMAVLVCSKLRLAAISWTVSSSACQAGDPYSGGGIGRTWSPLVKTHVVRAPARGAAGVSTNAGGVGCQKPGPAGMVAGSHLASAPSLLARATAISPTA